MKPFYVIGIVAVALCAWSAAASADSSGRIYGKIKTTDGDTYEGLIRWDKNEASWCDVLNGNKDLPRKTRAHRDRSSSRTIRIFGFRVIRYADDDYYVGSALSGISFGHIKRLEARGDDAARLTLKSGQEVELEGNSTDIGESLRGLVIEDRREGEIELDWEGIDYIEFMQAPPGLTSVFGDRLYGSLTTRRGDTYAGWICWDVDELCTEDVLDGEEGHRTRKIEFGRIASIERNSSNSARVKRTDGDELVLRGTNDVDDSNRGIAVYVENFGLVTVGWDDFDRVDFSKAPSAMAYDAFDGGWRLTGTVFTTDGESYTGEITWDKDEQYSWEILDGEFRDVAYDVEFGNVKEIRKRSSREAIVTTWSGQEFRLGGTNDVDEENKGIVIHTAAGKRVTVDWDEFDHIAFARR